MARGLGTERFAVEQLEHRVLLSVSLLPAAPVSAPHASPTSQASETISPSIATPILGNLGQVSDVIDPFDGMASSSLPSKVESGPNQDKLKASAFSGTWTGNIPDGTIWGAGSVQRITGNATVPSGAKLTIEAGAIIKFDPAASLNIAGDLEAKGTDALHAIFTSIRDDSTGSDDNGDGNSTLPAAGDWHSIWVQNKGVANLDHVEIRFSGKMITSNDGALVNSGGTLNLSDSIISASLDNGVSLWNGSATLARNTISNVAQFGIFADSTDPFSLTGNAIANAVSGPIRTRAGTSQILSGNSSTGSGLANSIELIGGTISDSEQWGDQLNYYLHDSVTISNSGALTIRPGLIVKFGQGQYLSVHGHLTAQGTDAAPIIFTSIKDDSAGGDTNGDGTATTPAAGDWDVLYQAEAATVVTLDHVQVLYAGKGSSIDAAVESFGGQLTLANSLIAHSSGEGVWIGSGKAILENNIISDVGHYGIRDETTDVVTLTSNQIKNAVTAPIKVHAGYLTTLTGNSSDGSGLGNSIQIFSGNAISDSETWDRQMNIVVAETITVGSTGSLQLQPGLVVKFALGAQLQVAGQITVPGTQSAPIIFTSLKDDSAGGDTNGDGNLTSPAAGDWDRLWIHGGKAVITYAEFRYGGKISGGQIDSGLSLSNGELDVSNTLVEHNSGEGVWIADGKASLQNNSITDVGRFGLRIDSTNPVTIIGNTIDHAVSGALRMKVVTPLTESGNNATNCGLNNAVYVEGGDITAPTAWNDNFTTYLITTNISVSKDLFQVAAGKILKFSHGVVLTLSGGNFTALGTDSAPIIFTSALDDQAGGDTNGDGSATSPAAGDWDRVWVNNSASTGTLDHVQLLYGGKISDGRGDSSISLSSGGTLLLTNSLVQNGFAHGVWLANGTGLVTNTVISNVKGDGIRVEDTARKQVITHNTINAAQIVAIYQNENSDLDFTSTSFNGNGMANAVFVNTGSLDGLRTWTGNATYWMAGDLNVGTSGNLTILPGAILKFQKGKGIQVTGRLNIPGNPNPASPLAQQATFTVTLTSAQDDLGGDTNGDGSASKPAPGDWFNLWQHDGSVVLNDTTLSYAGLEPIQSNFAGTPALLKDGGSLSLRNAILEANFDIGLRDRSSGKNLGLIADGLSIIQTGGDGISFQNSANAQLSGITLDQIGGAFMSVSPASDWILSNVTLGTATLPVMNIIGSGSINSPWTLGQIPNVLVGNDAKITVDNPGSITLLPGTIVKLGMRATMVANAPVYMNGDGSHFVQFTSIRDDSLGGDFNGDGFTTVPAAGDWGYIALLNPLSDVSFVQFRFGGGAAFGANPSSLVLQGANVSGSPLNFMAGGISIQDSAGDGLDILGPGTATIQDSVLANNKGFDIYRGSGTSANLILINNTLFGSKAGVFLDNGNLTLINSIIAGNSIAGVESTNSGVQIVSHFNDYFNPGASGGNFLNEKLPAWNPLDPASDVLSDPLFDDSPHGNFSLANGSPNIDSASGNDAPQYDFFGLPRVNDTSISNSGSGLVPFIDRGAFEKQASGSGIDLVPESLQADIVIDANSGHPILSVHFIITMKNDGDSSTSALAPSWMDTLYLHPTNLGRVSKQAPDIFLGTLIQTTPLAAGAETQIEGTFALPPVNSGLFLVKAAIDSNNSIPEAFPLGDFNNDLLSSAILTVAHPQLPADPLSLDLNSPNGAIVDLDPVQFAGGLAEFSVNPGTAADVYVGKGYLPGPGQYEQMVHLRAGDNPFVLALAVQQSETLFFIPTVPGSAFTPITISSFLSAGPQILNLFPSIAGNTGPVTFQFNGGPFDSEDQFFLKESDGTVLASSSSRLLEGAQGALATFNLMNVPPAPLTAMVQYDAGAFSFLPNAVSVVAGGAGHFYVNLTGPDVVRSGVANPFTLTWGNDGMGDLPVELISLDLPAGSHFSLHPDGKEILKDVALFSFAPATTNYSVLPAGGGASFQFYLTEDPGNPTPKINVAHESIDSPDLNTTANLADLLAESKPASADPARWDPMVAAASTLGSTWSSVFDGLTHSASVDFLADLAPDGLLSPDRALDAISDGASMFENLLGNWMASAYPPPPLPGKQADGIHQDFVIVIAMEDYRNEGSHNLPGTQEDATTWLNFFKDDLNISDSQITVLADTVATHDDDVTFAKIQDAWKKTVAMADADDKIKVIYSGHGDQADGAMIMNTPGNGANNDDLVSAAMLKQMFTDTPMPGETYMVFDSCYSGKMGMELQGIPNLRWNSAVSDTETAPDGDTFSSALVSAYQNQANDTNGDGKVYISEATIAAKNAFTKADQHPLSGGDPKVDQELHDDIGNAARDSRIQRRIVDLLNSADHFYHSITNVFAQDPNEKIGPAGFGAGNFIPGGQMFFGIYFENDAAQANAPAQSVTIIDHLDANLNWSTLVFGDVVVGKTTIELSGDPLAPSGQAYMPQFGVILEVNAHLDSAQGIIKWVFITLDPVTHEPTSDPLAGFLPPDVTKPEGEGHVNYTVSPKTGLAHGSDISNSASIVFDTNEPIATNQLTYKIDNQAPQVQSVTVNNGPQRSRVDQLQVNFNEDTAVQTSLSAFKLTNSATGREVSLSGATLTIDSSGHTVILDVKALALASGNYTLQIFGSGVVDAGGLAMAQDSKTQFYVLPGDANGDRVVNDLDLYRVWQNQLKQPANRDQNDDLNGDGTVDAADLKSVRDNFLKAVPTPATPQSVRLGAAASPVLSFTPAAWLLGTDNGLFQDFATISFLSGLPVNGEASQTGLALGASAPRLEEVPR